MDREHCKDQRKMCGKLFLTEIKVIVERLNGMDKALELKAEGLESRYVNRLTLIAIIFTGIQIAIQVVFLMIGSAK